MTGSPVVGEYKTVSATGTCPGVNSLAVLAGTGVTYCYKVAELGAFFYYSIAERASFNSAAGTDFDIVFENHGPDLRYFVVQAVMACETKTVLAYG